MTDINSIEVNTKTTLNKEMYGSSSSFKDYLIDSKNDRFPSCIVWTPLPIITYAMLTK